MESPPSENGRDRIKEWFETFIDFIREEYGKLNETRKEALGEFLYFKQFITHPVQVEVFWMNKPCEWQIIVITHDPERTDKEIIVHGPYAGHEFLYRINDVLNSEEWWKKEFPSDFNNYLKEMDIFTIEELPLGSKVGFSDIEKPTYADVFTKFLALFLHSERYSPLFGHILEGPDKHLMYFMMNPVSFPPDGQVEIFYGNIAELDQKKVLTEINEIAKSAILATTETLKEGSEEDIDYSFESAEIVGYAAYLYPPVWVFEKPTRDFFEQVLLKPPISDIPWWDTKIGDIKIEIYNNGRILVLTLLKEEARNVINLITSLLTIFVEDANFLAIRYSDLKEVYHNPRNPPGFYIFKSHMPYDESRTMYKYIHRSILSAPYVRPVIGVEAIKKAVEYAEIIHEDEDLVTILVLFLEASSHYFESEFNQSFIMGWVTLERLISRFWRRLWQNKRLSTNRRDTLDKWELHKKLEILELHGVIEEDVYNIIKALNGKRNDLVHHARPINRGDALRLLDTLKNLLKSEIESMHGD